MNSRIAQQSPESSTSPAAGRQTLRYAAAGAVFGCAFPVVATAIGLFAQRLPWSAANVLATQATDPLLWIIDTAPLFLGLLAAFAGRRQDALLATHEDLKLSHQDLTTLRSSLERSVEERTAELDQRNALLAALLSVTNRISGSPEVAGILAIVVDQVPQYFDGLQASIYLLDPSAGTLVLKAASSDAGKARLAQGYSVEVGGNDLVSRAAAHGTSETAQSEDGTQSTSEVAIPLSTRGRIVGVLALQPPHPRLLKPHEIEVLQLLADQVAAALDSARLLEESRSSVAQLQKVLREQTDESWQAYLTHQSMSLQYTPSGIRALPEEPRPRSKDSLQVPLALRGWQMGSLSLERKGDQQWTDEERQLVQKVVLQVALAIDNNRLLNETRRRALHEQTVSELSARFNQNVEIDALLRTAVREFAGLPEVNEASVVIRSHGAGSTQSGRASTLLTGYRYDNIRMEPVNSIGQAGATAMDRGVAIISDPGEARTGQGQSAAMPLTFRGQILGAVVVVFQRLRAPEGAITMINQAADRLATALENARLLQESIRRADQERRIADITAKIGGSISMRNVLQTAVEELGHAIPGSEVTIKLHPVGAAGTKEGQP